MVSVHVCNLKFEGYHNLGRKVFMGPICKPGEEKDGLCWRCKEAWCNGQVVSGEENILKRMPYLHCHHLPKEKTRCWCDGGSTIDLMDDGVAKISIHGELVERNFCIKCGKPFK